MTIRAAPAPDRRLPSDVIRRTEQVLDVLRDLRDRDAEDGGSASPEIDEAIREFSRTVDSLRSRQDGASAIGIARGDDNRPVQAHAAAGTHPPRGLRAGAASHRESA